MCFNGEVLNLGRPESITIEAEGVKHGHSGLGEGGDYKPTKKDRKPMMKSFNGRTLSDLLRAQGKSLDGTPFDK